MMLDFDTWFWCLMLDFDTWFWRLILTLDFDAWFWHLILTLDFDFDFWCLILTLWISVMDRRTDGLTTLTLESLCNLKENWIKRKINIVKLIMDGQVTLSLILPHPLDNGRTSYTFPPYATPTWLWKEKLHFTSNYFTHLIMEGQDTFPLILPHPPDYRRTSFPATPIWLWKLQFPSHYLTTWS